MNKTKAEILQEEVGLAISRAMYPTLKYDSRKTQNSQAFKIWKIFGRFGAIRGGNFVEGKHRNTHFAFSNLYYNYANYNGNRIYYGFTDGKVYVVIDEMTPFRVGVDLPLQTDQIFYNFIHPIEMVKEIIDTLNLNTRIWDKEED
jgi:hypothetical protein